MQSTTARGARRLLVTAGAMTLGLSAVAPGIVGADPGETPLDEKKLWVCHRTSSDEVNPWVLQHVNVNARDRAADRDIWIDTEEKLALLITLLGDDELSTLGATPAVRALISNACEEMQSQQATEVESGGENDDDNDDDDDDGDSDDDDDNDSDSDDDDNKAVGNGGDVGDGNDRDGNGNTNGNGNGVVVGGDEVTVPAVPGGPGEPATPASPVRPPRPVIISNDAVERPVTPAAPATPAPRVDENEVLGVSTTRTPTPVAGDTQVAAQTVTGSLPRTGADGTRGLVAAGGALVLAGLALEAASRRRKDAQPGGQLSVS